MQRTLKINQDLGVDYCAFSPIPNVISVSEDETDYLFFKINACLKK
jgi:hypothetical protein